MDVLSLLDVRLGDDIGVGSPLEAVGKDDDIILILVALCRCGHLGLGVGGIKAASVRMQIQIAYCLHV